METFVIISFIIFMFLLFNLINSKPKQEKNIITTSQTKQHSNSKKSKQNPIEKFNLKEGEEVNLWPKPNTYEIHAFAKGTIGSQGRLAVFNSKKIYRQVEEGEVYGKITMIKNNELKIEIFKHEENE